MTRPSSVIPSQSSSCPPSHTSGRGMIEQSLQTPSMHDCAPAAQSPGSGQSRAPPEHSQPPGGSFGIPLQSSSSMPTSQRSSAPGWMARRSSLQSSPQYGTSPSWLQQAASPKPSASASRKPYEVGSQSSSCASTSQTSVLPG